MQSATRGVFFILAFILFLFGVMDIAEQLKEGGNIHWNFPIILIGFGAGIPVVLFTYPEMFSTENHSDPTGDANEEYGLSDSGGDGGGD